MVCLTGLDNDDSYDEDEDECNKLENSAFCYFLNSKRHMLYSF